MNNIQELLSYDPNIKFEEFPQEALYLDLEAKVFPKHNVELSDVIPAIPTLYLKNWDIDLKALDNMLKDQKEAWITTVLIAGTTWEASFLEEKEHIEYIRNAVILAKFYWIQVLAWTWSNSTEEQDNLTICAFEAWATASLLLPPYYIKTSDVGLIRHLSSWLNHWPGIIYSISWRSWMPISNDVLEVLSKHPNFLWVKECDWVEKIKDLKRRWIRVWTWNDDESFQNIHRDDADGVITVVGNIDPELMLEVRDWVSMTKEKIVRLLTLSHLMFLPGHPNPIPVHNAMEMIRRAAWDILDPATFRSPWGPLNNSQQIYQAKWLNDLWIKARPFAFNSQIL